MTLDMTMQQDATTYRLKIDRLMLGILLAHLPFSMFLAPRGMGTESFAAVASLLVATVGIVGFILLRGQRAFGVLVGVLFMLMSAILIQAQLGRIEMHFHIFAALALMLIYRDWLTVVVPAIVIVVHHLLLNALQMHGATLADMPITVFNYGCGWGISFLHAFFVAFESLALVYFAIIMRKEHEQSIAAMSELTIAATVFESNVGMCITDDRNTILRVNRAFTDITGYTTEEAIGQTPNLLSSSRQDKDFYVSMWDSIKSIGAWQGELWNRRKNGEVYPQYLTITAVKNSSGIVNNYVATLSDITLSKAASEEITKLAFYDPLTKLPNRRLLLERLQQTLVTSARNGQQGALLFIDLDHFKTLNDTLGHSIGDLLLQQVAERLKLCISEGDTVARIGGDEFVLLLEGLGEHALEVATRAEVIATKILAVLNQTYQLDVHEYRNSPSIGITLFNGYEHKLEDLLKHADIAMYDAKKAGRNALRFFDPIMQERINLLADMEHDLRNAIERQEFELYYQVQVDSRRRAWGAEVLIRWVHPKRGMVSPIYFIPLAEETGLILPIGLWVLETACAQLKVWEASPLTRELTLSVNVSAKQFNQPEFVTQVQETIQRYAISPQLLKLELTESILVDNITHIITTMTA